jgi:hypothetical protein
LNTNEIQIQGPPTSTGPLPFASQGSHPLQQTQAAQQESQQAQSSPLIYFHHWVPPNTSSGQNPPTPSSKSQQGSPFAQNAPSHLRADYQNSPKKRKATGGHHPPPAPTNQSEASSQFPRTSSRDGESPASHQRGRRRDSRRGSGESSSRGYDAQPAGRASSRQVRPEHGGEGGEGAASNRQVAGSSSSTSGDESQMRMRGSESETRQSHYPAGPEMRERAAR